MVLTRLLDRYRRIQHGGAGPVQFLIIVTLLLLPLGQSAYWIAVATSAATYAMLGLGLNVVLGFAGLLDLGYAAFFALGAYTTGIMTTKFHVPFIATLPMAMVVAGAAGALLGYPTLRLRSDYLAMVTLGFGEMVRISFSNWSYAGGAEGVLGVPPPSFFNHALRGVTAIYLLSAALLAVALYASYCLADSRLGFAWRAVRTDGVVAEACGLPTVRLRLLAYTIGGVWGGLAGGFFAARLGIVTPTSFIFNISVEVLIIVVIGGLGSPLGVLFGSIVVVGVPEVLRSVDKYRLLAYAVVLIVLMIVRPQGVFPRAAKFVGVGRLGRRQEDTAATEPAVAPIESGNDRTASPIDSGGGALRVSQLSKSFGGVRAINSVSLVVEPGEIFGLIGPNGAGKTTLFNCVTGILKPDSGQCFLDGKLIRSRVQYRVARAGISRTFQTIRLLPNATVAENVVMGLYNHQRMHILSSAFNPLAERRAIGKLRAQAAEAMTLVGVDKYAETAASQLPYATQRQVEIARALAANPKILFLDEPAAGMNADEKVALTKLILTIRSHGVTVVLVEHDMSVVTSICDRVMVLDYGATLAEGSVSEVLSNPDVIEAYLGSDEPVTLASAESLLSESNDGTA